MQVFNKYPARYPALQKSLGDALAQISEVAMEGLLPAPSGLQVDFSVTCS
jgi:hypothetical protein